MLFHRTPDFHRVSLTQSVSQHERPGTKIQKAKYWDGLDQIDKRDPVGTPKVHRLKLGTRLGIDVWPSWTGATCSNGGASESSIGRVAAVTADHSNHWNPLWINWLYGTTNPSSREGVSPRSNLVSIYYN